VTGLNRLQSLTPWPEGLNDGSVVQDYELIAEQLSAISETVRRLELRMADVEKVNTRLEDAALTTARALAEISGHWDAVYEAMRRPDDSQRPG
jgi:hypothetical protein